ncbi:MAG TPA: rod shape-determining protein MreC [Saprospiraceae bacterium]|nr:rod shape-determining protein MreC [Saprospiraceae bacterium]
MRTLILLLLKRSSLLLFLVMELICAVLVINYNKKQKDIFIASSNFFAGKFYSQVNAVQGYFYLNAIADSLSNENKMLRDQLASSRYINIAEQDTFVRVRVDSLGGDSILVQFVYTDAEVINNSVASANNFFTINRGSLHGIKKSMGVVSAHGAVGIVSSVSPHFSTVRSLLNRDIKVSGNVLVEGKAFFGSLSWQNHDYRFLDMDFVPKSTKIAIGDSVVTNGFSSVFPQGYLIGKIDTFYVPPGSGYYKIKVKLAEDMTSLRRVYVANNLLKDEQKNLEEANE